MAEERHLEWLGLELDPAARLLSFRSWVAKLLCDNLFFSKIPEECAKQVGQCEAIVRNMVRDLEQRGYLFDGEPLKKLIENQVRRIAEQQRKGTIQNFYVYFKRVWRGYVDMHADNLGRDAKTMGYHISRQFNKKIRGLKTIPSLEAEAHRETLKEKLRKERKRQAREQAEKKQTTLF